MTETQLQMSDSHYREAKRIAEQSVISLAEPRLLGDISISVPVTVYDNGRHASPEVHAVPCVTEFDHGCQPTV